MGNIKPNEQLKKLAINDLCESFTDGKPQNLRKSIDLTNEQIDFIIQVCENEINENKEVIKYSKDFSEIRAWLDEIVFISNLIKDVKNNFSNKVGTQFVLQGLTKEQEDYIIESGLEQMRERRENE